MSEANGVIQAAEATVQTATVEVRAAPLDELARRINAGHAEFDRLSRACVGHAIQVGRWLEEVKARVGHGNFMPWVAEHVNFSHRWVSGYMFLAEHQHLLPKLEGASNLTVTAAISHVRDARRQQRR